MIYPLSKTVPTPLQTLEFVIYPLCTVNAKFDFEAYTSSPRTLKEHSAGRWKTVGFTLEENLDLLRHHESQYQERAAFAFLLWSHMRRKSLGCVYFLPLLKHCSRAAEYGYDDQAAMVTFWTRDDADEPAFSNTLVATLRNWLTEHWQFSDFVFRINERELTSRRALELNGFEKAFEDHGNQPKMLFYAHE